MENNFINVNCENIRIKLKEQWARLNDEDIDKIINNYQLIYDILQKQYDYCIEDLIKEVKIFSKNNHIDFP